MTRIPGRPFFICTAVRYASSAPAAARRSHERLAELRRHVVELGLEHQHALVRCRLVRLADHEAQHVGPAGRVARARAVADRLGPQRRQRAVGLRERR